MIELRNGWFRNYIEGEILMLEKMKKEKPTEHWKQNMKHGDEHYTDEIIEQSEKALDIFIDGLTSLGEKANEQTIMECVKSVVIRFNELDENYYFIETLEREEIFDFIVKAVTLAGIEVKGDITEEWRNW